MDSLAISLSLNEVLKLLWMPSNPRHEALEVLFMQVSTRGHLC